MEVTSFLIHMNYKKVFLNFIIPGLATIAILGGIGLQGFALHQGGKSRLTFQMLPPTIELESQRESPKLIQPNALECQSLDELK